MHWYSQAAEKGIVRAQEKLGLMYADGSGVPKDNVQAYAWWNIAAAQNNEVAKNNLNVITKKMTPAAISEAQQLSREYWGKYGPNRGSSE